MILTTEANPSVSDIHHYMPLILTEDQLMLWERDADFVASLLTKEMPPMIKAKA